MSQTTAATMTTFVILTTMLMVVTVVSGQGAMPPSAAGGTCGANLVVCVAALSGGIKPPKECCDSLETAVETQLPCLCGVLADPQVLAAFNLTVEAALLIPTSCGIDGSSLCAAALGDTPGAAPEAAPGTAPKAAPVAAPVPGPQEDDKAAATKLVGTGLVGFVLTAISIMF